MKLKSYFSNGENQTVITIARTDEDCYVNATVTVDRDVTGFTDNQIIQLAIDKIKGDFETTNYNTTIIDNAPNLTTEQKELLKTITTNPSLSQNDKYFMSSAVFASAHLNNLANKTVAQGTIYWNQENVRDGRVALGKELTFYHASSAHKLTTANYKSGTFLYKIFYDYNADLVEDEEVAIQEDIPEDEEVTQ